MMKTYKVKMTTEFREQWRKEYNYSKKIWGQPHAREYFNKFRVYLNKTLGTMAWGLVDDDKILDKSVAYVSYQRSHQVLFEVLDGENVVLLLDLYGRHRFHELQQLKLMSDQEKY